MHTARWILLCFLSLCTVSRAFAQYEKERMTWYFGDLAGLDFHTDPPTVLTNSQVSATEGHAVANDNNGNLLFYTDGIRIWDRSHTLMPNGTGLKGNASSTQAALIVNKPGAAGIYYVFTTDAAKLVNGLCYSEVDMSLNGGMGDVIQKNQPIVTPVTEKLTAFLHANNKDFWIICQEAQSNTFRAYLLNAGGLDTSVYVKSKGGKYNNIGNNYAGVMKASFDNKKLVVVYNSLHLADIFHFDNNTGVLDNVYSLPSVSYGFYGACFSPNSRFVYLMEFITGSPGMLLQYDLEAGDTNQVRLSVKVVTASTLLTAADMQVAPNGKVYIARPFRPYLSIVPNPDLPYPSCGFIDTGQLLDGRLSRFGLPNFPIWTPNKTSIIKKDTCLGDSTDFSFNPGQADSVSWDFGDPVSGSANRSAQLKPKHVYSSAGTYTVTLYRYSNATTDTTFHTFTIRVPAKLTLGADTILCPGDSLKLGTPLSGNFTYTWSTGDTGSFIYAKNPGTYSLNAYDGCSSSDTITIQQDTGHLNLSLGEDTQVCPGEEIFLNTGVPGATYLWQDSSTGSGFTITRPGLYFVTVKKGCLQASDTLQADSCSCAYNISNAFSPDGDGVNELFRPETCTFGDPYRFQVFNRWGQLLFETTDRQAYWDGRTGGQELPAGAYFWIISYPDPVTQGSRQVRGIIRLFR